MSKKTDLCDNIVELTKLPFTTETVVPSKKQQQANDKKKGNYNRSHGLQSRPLKMSLFPTLAMKYLPLEISLSTNGPSKC